MIPEHIIFQLQFQRVWKKIFFPLVATIMTIFLWSVLDEVCYSLPKEKSGLGKTTVSVSVDGFEVFLKNMNNIDKSLSNMSNIETRKYEDYQDFSERNGF
jgi:hypothetical protein